MQFPKFCALLEEANTIFRSKFKKNFLKLKQKNAAMEI